MSRLLRVELRRILSRRLFRFVTLAVVVALVGAGVIVFFVSNLSPAEFEQARIEREAALQNCIETQGFGAAPEGTDDVEAFCSDQMGLASGDPRFDYARVVEDMIGLAFPFLMLGWIMGASFIGAEWHNRTLTTILTWEPRRIRVLVAKIIALILVVGLWILFLLSLYAAVMYPAAAAHGVTTSVDASLLRELVGTMLRVDALAVIAALLGFSLATIGRNTSAALGVGFAYLTVVEGIIRGFKPAWSDWLVGDNIALFLVGNDESPLTHDQTTAALILVAYTCILLAGATVLFRRREMA